MKVLTADEILAAQDIETREVEVAEWGGTVRIAGLSGLEREAFETAARDARALDASPNFRALLLSHTLRDENGGLLFSTAQVLALGKKSGKVLDRLYDIAADISLVTEKAIDGAVKN